jgi:tetratricopeptide (TPR) repeat protein
VKRSAYRKISLFAAGLLPVLFFSCASVPEAGRGLTDYDIHLKKGDGYYFMSRYAEAAAEYSLAIEIDSRRPDAYRFRGFALLAHGEFQDARKDFERALEISPDYPEAHLGLGILLFRQGNYAEAIDAFDRTTELDPWNSLARYYKALACEKVGRLREAVEAYKGYIHCAVPSDDGTVEQARERIRELESFPR